MTWHAKGRIMILNKRAVGMTVDYEISPPPGRRVLRSALSAERSDINGEEESYSIERKIRLTGR